MSLDSRGPCRRPVLCCYWQVIRSCVSYRKACASYTTCLIVSAGYQPFCSPGRVGSVCISCCNTPLCNGPRPPRISKAHVHTPLSRTLILALAVTMATPPAILL
ncbi:hypothetical protein NFI96_020330 [Prochilodus magdalenae]|nr:hypothetical protein NFI96_020330 [Prochilodus magdalenae]